VIISYEPTANDTLPLKIIYGTEHELAIYLRDYILVETTTGSYWKKVK